MRPSQTSPTDPDDSAESLSRANRLTDGPGITYVFGALLAVLGLVAMVYSMTHGTTGKWPLFGILTAVVLLAGGAGWIERFWTRRGKFTRLASVLLQAIEVVTPLSVGVGWLFFGTWGTTPEDQQLFKGGALLTTIGAVIIAVTARRLMRAQDLRRRLAALRTELAKDLRKELQADIELQVTTRRAIEGGVTLAHRHALTVSGAGALVAFAAAVAVRSIALTKRSANG